MKVVHFESGRTIALFKLEEFTPARGINEKALSDLIAERYRFSRRPDFSQPRTVLESQTAFETGEFQSGNTQYSLHKLEIHRDGIVVDASTTEISEGFADDLIGWLKREKEFRETAITKLFLNQMVVDFQKPLSRLFKGFDAISNIMQRCLSEDGRPSESIVFVRFDAEPGPREGLRYPNSPRFVIERRVGTEVGQERYYCSAPLRTDTHLAALEAIEHLVD